MADITYADKAAGSTFSHEDANEIKTAVNTKVDKVTGKGLSTEDYTTTEKNKLAGISGNNTGDETASTIVTKIGDGSKISSTYLPSYVDDVLEYANEASFPVTGEQGKIYVALDTNHQYRWSGSAYVDFTQSISYASQAEAEGNTENTKIMTSLRVFQNWIYNAANYSISALNTTVKNIVGAINELRAGVNTGLNDKKDFLWNFDTIPNVETDGIPDPNTEPNKYYLFGMYFDRSRGHFRVGRINPKDCFPTTDAEYSLVSGWGCHAVDPTESADGFNSKGNVVGGYQCLSAGRYGGNFGFNNILANGGFSGGWGNWSGGLRYQIIGQTFVDGDTPGTITVAGDRTSTFTANKIVAIKLYKSDDVVVVLNRVVSSVYSAPNTIITLVAPLPFLYVDDTALALHDKLNKSWITTLGEGSAGCGAIGVDNYLSGNYTYGLGVDNVTYNTYGVAIGKQAVTRSKGEIAMGSGQIINGTSTRYSQKSSWHLKGFTNSTTPKELTLDSNTAIAYTNTLNLQVNATYIMDIKVAAYSSYFQEGWAKTWRDVIVRVKGDGTATVLLEGTPTTTAGTGLEALNAVLTTAANGKIVMTVTGVATREVDWTCWIDGVIAGVDAPTKIN